MTRRHRGHSNPMVGLTDPSLGREVRAPHTKLARESVPPQVAYQLIHDELLLDGSARMNLATFVGTWMEPEAHRLVAESMDKNMIDKDEYPQTADVTAWDVYAVSRRLREHGWQVRVVNRTVPDVLQPALRCTVESSRDQVSLLERSSADRQHRTRPRRPH